MTLTFTLRLVLWLPLLPTPKPAAHKRRRARGNNVVQLRAA